MWMKKIACVVITIASTLPTFQLESGAQQPVVPTAATLRLDQLEAMALENNPTLRQAAAEIHAAQGRRQQAGLLPNPRVGYTGEEIRGGAQRGGQQGFFVEQEIILGGKLGLGRKVFEQEIKMAEIESEEQRLRVQNAVRLGYVQVLAAQEMLATLRELARLGQESADTAARLRNIGQADETEVLQAEIEMQQAELAVAGEATRLDQLWSALAAVLGLPNLPPANLEGKLDENIPQLDDQAILSSLLQESPAVRIAETNVARAGALLASARRQSVPDLVLRGGLQQNRALSDATGQPTGKQGFAEVGIQLPLFNRNQGTVAAARAAQEHSEQEHTRVKLVLRERATAVLQQYKYAQLRVERYRKEILPRAQRAFELMQSRWGQMSASYPQVLSTQRTLLQSQTDYLAALGWLRVSALTLEGHLVVDGLEAPARPSEVDLPIRETNIPTARGAAGQRE